MLENEGMMIHGFYTYTHMEVICQEGRRLGLVALRGNARGVDEAKRVAGMCRHVGERVEGVVVADGGDGREIHVFGLRGRDA